MAERIRRTERFKHLYNNDSVEVAENSGTPGKHERWLPAMPRETYQEIGRKVLRNERERSREKLYSEYGVKMLNKGELIGNPNRPIEDHTFVSEQKGLFAVFDGAGGVRGGAEASSVAAHKLSEITFRKELKTRADMVNAMLDISRAVTEAPNAGVTTGVVGQILRGEDGKKSLLWASVGDSRIYQTRGGGMRCLTQDEGVGNVIYNCLGREGTYVKQVGFADLEDGDSLLFCSDGVTGDFEKDFIPEPEIYRMVAKTGSAQEAADTLVNRATKKDDRSAVVVRI